MSATPQSPALWQQLVQTARLFDRVMNGESTHHVLTSVAPELKAGVQALLMSVLRHAALARAASVHLAPKRVPDAVMALLQTSLALMQVQPPPYGAHTLVHQTIEAAKSQRHTRHAAGFINACLRRWLRQADELRTLLMADPCVRWNLPRWWIDRLRADHGPEQAQAIMRAYQSQAPMSLRVNARWGDAEQLLAHWQAEGIEAWVTGSHSLQLRKPCAVNALPGFAQGWCSVQDWAAQLAAPLLTNWQPSPERLPTLVGRPEMRYLDACAAPGGKTAHLLEISHAQVWALDQDRVRLSRVEDNLRRIQRPAHVVHANAAAPRTWWDGQAFDGILLDAPCTASGIVRRHPDVPWLRRESDVRALAAQQKELLEALWPLLKPGGVMVYCTCSVFKAEGENQIQAFLQRHKQAQRGKDPGHLFPQLVNEDTNLGENPGPEHDGFFYARMHKLG